MVCEFELILSDFIIKYFEKSPNLILTGFENKQFQKERLIIRKREKNCGIKSIRSIDLLRATPSNLQHERKSK